MKSAVLIALTTFLLFACSKDARINNRLEGSWKMRSVNGKDLPNQYYSSRTYEFEELKNKTGRVSIHTNPVNGNDYNFFGTYTLNNKGDIHIVATDDYGNALNLDYHITKISSNTIKWTVIASDVEEYLEH